MRKPIIAGNWKMNKKPSEAVELAISLKPLVTDADIDVVVCPTFVCLPAVIEALKGSNIKVGAQNMHWESNGAYTGEIAPEMLKELGVEYVVLGHSERREYFAETDETVNKKMHAAFTNGLVPIVCCGETLEQREAGVTQTWVVGQIKAGIKGLTTEQAETLVIAYEPIWAIGTGKTATNDDANEVIGWIRETVCEMYGETVGAKTRIQYGGSMKPGNAAELMAMSEIDGGLVGGASLQAEDFANIINYNK
jgi:triosephosphate isomerase